MAPSDNRSFYSRVAALASSLPILGPSPVWAHGGTPHEGATTGLTSPWAFVFVAALISIWVARCLHLSRRIRCLTLEPGRGVSWAVLGLLGIHLIALPPHLVHHLASPPDEGMKCILFLQGNISDQERAEPAPLVGALAPAETMADCPLGPAQVFPIPTPSGRSPPGFWI